MIQPRSESDRRMAVRIANTLEYRGGYMYPGRRWMALRDDHPLPGLVWSKTWSRPGNDRDGDPDRNLEVLQQADTCVEYIHVADGRAVRVFRRDLEGAWYLAELYDPDEGSVRRVDPATGMIVSAENPAEEITLSGDYPAGIEEPRE